MIKHICNSSGERTFVFFINKWKDILGTGRSPSTECIPNLVLFDPGSDESPEPKKELDGSISHGEILFCRLDPTSFSHLTCKNEKKIHHINNRVTEENPNAWS